MILGPCATADIQLTCGHFQIRRVRDQRRPQVRSGEARWPRVAGCYSALCRRCMSSHLLIRFATNIQCRSKTRSPRCETIAREVPSEVVTAPWMNMTDALLLGTGALGDIASVPQVVDPPWMTTMIEAMDVEAPLAGMRDHLLLGDTMMATTFGDPHHQLEATVIPTLEGVIRMVDLGARLASEVMDQAMGPMTNVDDTRCTKCFPMIGPPTTTKSNDRPPSHVTLWRTWSRCWSFLARGGRILSPSLQQTDDVYHFRGWLIVSN